MEEKTFIFEEDYLVVKALTSLIVKCREGRTSHLEVDEDKIGEGQQFLLIRKDILYNQSDTILTMCHLTFVADDLTGLELTQSHFFPNILLREEYKGDISNLSTGKIKLASSDEKMSAEVTQRQLNVNYTKQLKKERYIFTQSSLAKTWEVNHNLGRFPSVQIIDSSDNEVMEGEIKHSSENKLVINFNRNIKGIAILN